MDGPMVATALRLNIRGGDVVVRSAGNGPRIGYLHGMIGTPEGHPFLDALAAAGRTVTAPCLPGFSGSDPNENLRSIFDWVSITSEVIDAAGLTGLHMVASSVGAMLALEVASMRPEAFSSLTLIAPLGLWDDEDPVADAWATTLSNQRLLLTADAGVTEPFFERNTVDDNMARYFTRTAAASLMWPIPEFGLADRLHRVTCPVTLIWGSADAINPPSYLHRYRERLANVVSTHLIDGAGHHAEWDSPDEVAALLHEKSQSNAVGRLGE